MATLTRHQRMVLLDVCRVLTRDRYRPRAVTAKNLRNAVAYDPSPSETKDYRTLQVWPVGAAMALEHLADKGYLRRIKGLSSRSTFTAYVLTDLGWGWWNDRTDVTTDTPG